MTRTFSEVHHFILKFVFLYSTNMISTCSIKIISPKSSTKSMIQEINQTYPVTPWLSYTFPSLKSLRRIPKVPYHQAMFSEDQFNTCLRADCSWEFVYFNEQGICVRVFESNTEGEWSDLISLCFSFLIFSLSLRLFYFMSYYLGYFLQQCLEHREHYISTSHCYLFIA